jgi:hypothetical protein
MVEGIEAGRATCSRCRQERTCQLRVDAHLICDECLTDAENLEWGERVLAGVRARIVELLDVAPPGWPDMVEEHRRGMREHLPVVALELHDLIRLEGELFQSVEDQREMMDTAKLRDFVGGVEAALAEGTTLDPDQMEFFEQERARLRLMDP